MTTLYIVLFAYSAAFFYWLAGRFPAPSTGALLCHALTVTSAAFLILAILRHNRERP